MTRPIYTIKDIAEYVGVTTQAIMDAEREGRIPAARRDALGHRLYDESDRERIGALMGRR